MDPPIVACCVCYEKPYELRSSNATSGKPFALPPFVLTQLHAAELGEAAWWIVEHAQDRFAVVYGQRDKLAVGFVGLFERGGGAVKPVVARHSSDERNHVAVVDGDPASCPTLHAR